MLILVYLVHNTFRGSISLYRSVIPTASCNLTAGTLPFGVHPFRWVVDVIPPPPVSKPPTNKPFAACKPCLFGLACFVLCFQRGRSATGALGQGEAEAVRPKLEAIRPQLEAIRREFEEAAARVSKWDGPAVTPPDVRRAVSPTLHTS